MPIDIQCHSCGSRFRVVEKFAGKRVKCPNCHGVIEVPATGLPPVEWADITTVEASSTTRPVAPPTEQEPTAGVTAVTPSQGGWYMHSAAGERYGPVSREQIDAWVAEGRIDASCQLLQEGWAQWKWAEEVYPQLAEQPVAASPAASPAAFGEEDALAALRETPSVPPPAAVAEEDALAAIADYATAAKAKPYAAAEAKPLATSAAQTDRRRYPALAIISWVFTALAWVLGGLGVLYAVLLAVWFANDPHDLTRFGVPQWATVLAFFVIETNILVLAVLAWVFPKAVAEIIKVAINAEDDIRVAREACVKTAEQLAERK